MQGVYAIIDLSALDAMRVDPLRFVDALLGAGVAALQLRGKRAEGGRQLSILREIVPTAKARGVPVFANDRADLALMAGCDGIHVGQGDTPPIDVRALSERAGAKLLVGLSTHDEAQVDASFDAPVDYIAIGPVFGTVSKEHPDAVLGLDRSLAMAKRARAARPDRPIVAIGGIGTQAAARLSGAFDAIAVISALLPESRNDLGSTTERTRELVEAFRIRPSAVPPVPVST
jgi:thiamine-phosphate pyrophosphorylase